MCNPDAGKAGHRGQQLLTNKPTEGGIRCRNCDTFGRSLRKSCYLASLIFASKSLT